jgi:hypothetical protein
MLLDSSGSPIQPEKQNSPKLLVDSTSPLYQQTKLSLLESYRAKAEVFWKTLVDAHPESSILDLQNAFFCLLIPVTSGPIRAGIKMMLSDNLDAELQANGLLPKQEESKDSNSVSQDSGSVPEVSNISDIESRILSDPTP